MQPYFLPYLGYFSLIAATDRFVPFDAVQYIRRGWVNRNRILKPDRDDAQYIRVPVAKHDRETPIRDIRIASDPAWKSSIVRQLEHYRRSARHFDETMRIMEECLSWESDSLAELNVHCLRVVCRSLQIPFNFVPYDEIVSQVKPAKKPGDWALHISQALQATTYINAPGGRGLFDPQAFDAAGIELLFLQNSLSEYPQRNQQHIAGLSIVDVLMFCGIENTRHRILADTTLSPANENLSQRHESH